MGKSATERVITFGADPELFALNQQGNLIPVWELGVKGEKGKPEPIDGSNYGVGYLKDGVALEFNLNPQPTLRDVHTLLNNNFKHILKLPNFAAKKVKFDLSVDTIEVQKKYQANPGFTEIGCTVDMDAFSEVDIRMPCDPAAMGSLRFTGGHIHIGCNPWPEWLPKKAFVQFLSALYHGNFGSTASPREEFYGMPGIWRETPYGVEYRTPSTYWLRGHRDHLSGFESAISSLLKIKDDTRISDLARIYNSGTLPELREYIGKKHYSSGSRVATSICVDLDNIMRGRRKIMRPIPVEPEGYSRINEDGQERKVDLNDGAPRARRGAAGLGDVLYRHVAPNWNAEADERPLPEIFGNLGFRPAIGTNLRRGQLIFLNAWLARHVDVPRLGNFYFTYFDHEPNLHVFKVMETQADGRQLIKYTAWLADSGLIVMIQDEHNNDVLVDADLNYQAADRGADEGDFDVEEGEPDDGE